MEALDRRLGTLETLLRESQRPAPGAHIPPDVENSSSPSRSIDLPRCSPAHPSNELPSLGTCDAPSLDQAEHCDIRRPAPPTSRRAIPEQDLFKRLLSKTGHFTYDKGTIRYFGPTTNIHIFSRETHEAKSPSSLAIEQAAVKMIRQLPLDTHDYLLNLFWKNYNSVIEVVPQAPFLDGYKQGGDKYYSVFLHTIILAMGVRYADKSRPDIGVLMVSRYESKLQMMGKRLVEPAIETGGLSAIQGILLLSDIENGCGKDIVGWMYGGMFPSHPFKFSLCSPKQEWLVDFFLKWVSTSTALPSVSRSRTLIYAARWPRRA